MNTSNNSDLGNRNTGNGESLASSDNLCVPSESKVPKYRFLGDGDVVQAGDEFYYEGEPAGWRLADNLFEGVHVLSDYRFRRAL